MRKFRQLGLLALQMLVVFVTVVSTMTAFLYPACAEHMLAEIVRAVLAGGLLSCVKILVAVNHPTMIFQSLRCWYRIGQSTAWREVKHGLVAGYLLGLVVAVWNCWNG